MSLEDKLALSICVCLAVGVSLIAIGLGVSKEVAGPSAAILFCLAAVLLITGGAKR